MSRNTFVVLTGGPGGGKSSLIEEIQRDPAWSGRIGSLPEAISFMSQVGLSLLEPLFQRTMVHLQMALEDGLDRAFVHNQIRLILCHRGSLDPLAYWLDRGWAEEEFFAFTGTRLEEHYRRYAAVIHMVTSADGATPCYARWPEAHRPEEVEDAVRLDRLLHRIWSGHPGYHRLDNAGRDWAAKSLAARRIVGRYLSGRQPS
jgi:hypothetical protein